MKMFGSIVVWHIIVPPLYSQPAQVLWLKFQLVYQMFAYLCIQLEVGGLLIHCLPKSGCFHDLVTKEEISFLKGALDVSAF